MNPRRQAAVATVIAAIILVALLLLVHLNAPMPDDDKLDIKPELLAMEEEEFVDFLDMSYGPSDPSPAYAPEPVKRQ